VLARGHVVQVAHGRDRSERAGVLFPVAAPRELSKQGHGRTVSTMPPPPITLEVLHAGYGDCLLIDCPVGTRTWRLLIETGPDECYPQLQARLAALPVDANGRRFIDVFVVTHIDHDHIGGAGKLLGDTSLKLSFGDIWFNAPKRPAPRGVAEGEALSQILGAPARALPWNKVLGGQHVVTDAEGAFLQLPRKRGAPQITLLSPTPERHPVFDVETSLGPAYLDPRSADRTTKLVLKTENSFSAGRVVRLPKALMAKIDALKPTLDALAEA
jgi:hypothetical protein